MSNKITPHDYLLRQFNTCHSLEQAAPGPKTIRITLRGKLASIYTFPTPIGGNCDNALIGETVESGRKEGRLRVGGNLVIMIAMVGVWE